MHYGPTETHCEFLSHSERQRSVSCYLCHHCLTHWLTGNELLFRFFGVFSASNPFSPRLSFHSPRTNAITSKTGERQCLILHGNSACLPLLEAIKLVPPLPRLSLQTLTARRSQMFTNQINTISLPDTSINIIGSNGFG